ncbi:MAG: hypothetical protein ACYCUM_14280 [Solirubrobacteraceae bacterium]
MSTPADDRRAPLELVDVSKDYAGPGEVVHAVREASMSVGTPNPRLGRRGLAG